MSIRKITLYKNEDGKYSAEHDNVLESGGNSRPDPAKVLSVMAPTPELAVREMRSYARSRAIFEIANL